MSFVLVSDLVSDVESYVDLYSESCIAPDGSVLFLLNNEYAVMSVSDLQTVYTYGNRRISDDGVIHVNYMGEDVFVVVTDEVNALI